MVGAAIWRALEAKGYTNLIGRNSKELDLKNQQSVQDFFTNEKEGGVGFGLGFNVGKKYKTKNGWVAEFSFGLSRTLINSEKINLIYPRGGIIIGKIF
jgi:hypothetical protein